MRADQKSGLWEQDFVILDFVILDFSEIAFKLEK